MIDDVLLDPVTSTIYHNERRSTGANALVNTHTGTDVVAGPDWDVRTGVQEYGGAAAIIYDGNIYFSNIKDGRVYIAQEGETPHPVTPGGPSFLQPVMLAECNMDFLPLILQRALFTVSQTLLCIRNGPPSSYPYSKIIRVTRLKQSEPLCV